MCFVANAPEERLDDICVSMAGFIIALVVTALLAMVAVAVAVSCWLIAYRRAPLTVQPLPHPMHVPNPALSKRPHDDSYPWPTQNHFRPNATDSFIRFCVTLSILENLVNYSFISSSITSVFLYNETHWKTHRIVDPRKLAFITWPQLLMYYRDSCWHYWNCIIFWNLWIDPHASQ